MKETKQRFYINLQYFFSIFPSFPLQNFWKTRVFFMHSSSATMLYTYCNPMYTDLFTCRNNIKRKRCLFHAWQKENATTFLVYNGRFSVTFSFLAGNRWKFPHIQNQQKFSASREKSAYIRATKEAKLPGIQNQQKISCFPREIRLPYLITLFACCQSLWQWDTGKKNRNFHSIQTICSLN